MNGRPTAAAAGKIDVGGDLTVNRLGFGAMRITGQGIWREPPDRDRAKAALRRAVELDVTFIDTADSYGPEVSEQLIAEALYPYPDDLVIATKGGQLRPGPGRWEPDGRPEHLRQACEGSLARLRLDRIDLYQFHRPDPKVPVAESIGALAELRDEGKIRHIGVSNFSEEQLREAERVTPVVSVQNRYNVADRSSEQMVDLCEQETLVFLPWAPMVETDVSIPLLEAARRRGVSPRQVALAWLLARSRQILPIPGSGDPDHVEQNIAAASLDLTPEEVAAISQAPKIRRLYRHAPHGLGALVRLALLAGSARPPERRTRWSTPGGVRTASRHGPARGRSAGGPCSARSSTTVRRAKYG